MAAAQERWFMETRQLWWSDRGTAKEFDNRNVGGIGEVVMVLSLVTEYNFCCNQEHIRQVGIQGDNHMKRAIKMAATIKQIYMLRGSNALILS